MATSSVLEVSKLSKTYPVRKGQPVKAVDNISFQVKRGEIFGLLGPNGAGKTTTVKMICSLIKPDSGEIKIDGISAWKQRNKALTKISAVLEGNRNIYWRLTVKENLEFFAALKGINPKKIKGKIDFYIELFDLQDKLNETARKLSRGMQQKLAIAVAMIAQSEVVLLDEPTLGLDVKASYEVRDLLKKLAGEDGRTIVLTTHDMNVVQDTCERAIIINHGRIIAQDRVDRLIRLFQVKSYKFVIADKVSQAQKNQLRLVPHLTLHEKERETIIDLNLEDSGVLYQVIKILSQEKSPIESIDRQEINFEKVFMEIINGSEPS